MVGFARDAADDAIAPALPKVDVKPGGEAGGLEAGGADGKSNDGKQPDNNMIQREIGTEEALHEELPEDGPADKDDPQMKSDQHHLPPLSIRTQTAGAPAAAEGRPPPATEQDRTPTPPREDGPWFVTAKDWNLVKKEDFPPLDEVAAYIGVGGGGGAAPGSQPAQRPPTPQKRPLPERKKLVRIKFLPDEMEHEIPEDDIEADWKEWCAINRPWIYYDS